MDMLGSDGDYEDADAESAAVTMANLVITNKVLEDLLDEFGERLLITKRLIQLALGLPDLHQVRILNNAAFSLLSQKLKTEFIADWLDSDDNE